MTTSKRDIPVWLPFVLLVALIAALFHRLFGGETLFWGLPTLQFYAWREFAFEQLRRGSLPAWNPYLGAGAPLFANYQTAIFYPPNWLWLIMPGTWAMTLVALLHIVWSWLGMWYLSGALGFSTWGRAVSAFAYAFSGYLIARLMSFPTANAGAWLPWLFWLIWRVLHLRRAQDVGWLALAFGLQLLSGHAQTTWYGGVGLGLFALWIVLWPQRGTPLRARLIALTLAGVAMLLGVLLAAVQLLPTAEYLAESQRSDGLDYATLTNLSYHPVRLITLLSPDFFGTPADGSYVTKGMYFEDAAYIGLIPLIAALAALWAWLRQLRARRVEPARTIDPVLRSVPFWLLLVLLGFFLALGKHNPVFRMLADTVPTFDAFREPVRWLILPTLALAVLAGAGVEQWGRGPRIVFWSRLSAAGGGAMALMALGGLAFGDFSRTLEVLAWGMVVLGSDMASAALLTLVQPVAPLVGNRVLWRTVVLAVIVLDLGWFARGLNPTLDASFFEARPMPDLNGRVYWFDDYEYEVTFGSDDADDAASSDASGVINGYFDVADYRIAVRRHEELRASLLPNITMLDRVPAFSNNDPLLPAHYSAYRDLIEDLGLRSGALLQAAGVGEVFGLVPAGWTSDDGVTAHAPYTAQRAWLVTDAVWLDTNDEIAAALRDPAWHPLEQVILTGVPAIPEVQSAGEVGSAEPGEVALLDDQPAERRYRVTTDRATYLVIAETAYPGWTGTVNGQEAPLYRANLAFMAVAVPPGTSEIVLRYQSTHFSAALVLTLLACALLVILLVIPLILDRRRGVHG